MRKYFLILFIIFYSNLILFSQNNLVPNSSFEAHDTFCNTGIIILTPPWQNPTGGSPNYFNSCTTLQPDFDVPYNMFGFQNPHSGDGYALFGTVYYNAPFLNHREYIQVKLLESLTIDKKYSVKFFVSLADSSNYAVDRVGLYFSDTAIYKSIYDYSPFTEFSPQIENPVGNFIFDKINWTLISGIYTAHGGEQYITIGNFYNDANTDTIFLSDGSITQPKESGFYIDDISVTLKEEDSLNSFSIPNAFTPNNDSYNDNFAIHGQNIKSISGKIFNRWGQELYNFVNPSDSWDGKYKGNDVSEGVYFYVISVTFTNGEIQEKHGSIQLIR